MLKSDFDVTRGFEDVFMLENAANVIVKKEVVDSIRKAALLEAARRARNNFGEVISADSLERMAME